MNVRRTVLSSGLFLVIITLMAGGCASPKGSSAAEKRDSVQKMRQTTLDQAYMHKPELRQKVEQSPGYAVFSGYAGQGMILSSGNAYGIVRDNKTGQDTYMRAAKLGAGLGMGITDVRAVVVFTDDSTLQKFLTSGWVFGGRGTAAAAVSGEGADVGAVVTAPGMEIYRFTENGLMLGGAGEGAKVWIDQDLNAQ